MEIVFIGHRYHQENLLAIARLRGNTLKSLVFAQRFIATDIESWHKSEAITHVSRDLEKIEIFNIDISKYRF